MDFMKAMIRDAKKDIASSKKRKLDNSEVEGLKKKRFLTRAEKALLEEAEREAERAKRNEGKGNLEAVAEVEEDGASESPVKGKADAEDSKHDLMPEMEVKRRLRSMGQPITLFGEGHRERFERLKIIEIDAHEKQGASKGVANLWKDIMEKEVENEIMAATLAGQQTEEEKGQEAAKLKEKLNKRQEKYEVDKTREDFQTAETFILWFFKRILYEWERELDARPSEIKATTKGKVASATQKQTRQHMRPFFKDLKKKNTHEDVLNKVEKIVKFCLEREYVKANECYMLMAIGNAAWPMGVTSVGIHERAGRSKIFSAQIAHVLNDETARKYIQSIKRLMTFCQHKRPNVPSKNVM
jgi:pre-mRNA-splicing factor 18